MSRGSVRVPVPAPAVRPVSGSSGSFPPGPPRAAASNCARASPSRPSAAASRRVVWTRGVRLIPSSRSLIDRGLRPAARRVLLRHPGPNAQLPKQITEEYGATEYHCCALLGPPAPGGFKCKTAPLRDTGGHRGRKTVSFLWLIRVVNPRGEHEARSSEPNERKEGPEVFTVATVKDSRRGSPRPTVLDNSRSSTTALPTLHKGARPHVRTFYHHLGFGQRE
jgi:hypothetical protein